MRLDTHRAVGYQYLRATQGEVIERVAVGEDRVIRQVPNGERTVLGLQVQLRTYAMQREGSVLYLQLHQREAEILRDLVLRGGVVLEDRKTQLRMFLVEP